MVDDNVRQPYAAAHGMTTVRTSFDSQSTALPHDPHSSSRGGASDFREFAAGVKRQVDEALAEWVGQRIADAGRRGPDVHAVANAVGHLAIRGGRRMRPVLLAAAFEACAGEGGIASVMPAAVALELLQAYLLVHDDWMDGDQVRRGGPSVPAMMKERFPGVRADAMSILAGDLAAAWARRALLEAVFPPERVVRAAAELARVEEEVVQGQVLDVCGAARDAAEVEAVHALKTASYSVRGPVVIGAHLAGADLCVVAALAAFAVPLGVAFQLRDDVLGVFGDPIAMGKPRGSDMRTGKRSAILIECVEDPTVCDVLLRTLGNREATDEDVLRATATLEVTGVRERVEARIEGLSRGSREALSRANLQPHGRALLAEAIEVFTCGRG